MLERAQGRALPMISRGVEFVPTAQACCGACRTCVTTSVLTLAIAGVTGAAIYVARGVRRVFTAESW